MKIEEQELKQLQELEIKYNQIIQELGHISLDKIILFNRKEKVKEILKEIKSEDKTLKEFLISKYGDNININLENGEF